MTGIYLFYCGNIARSSRRSLSGKDSTFRACVIPHHCAGLVPYLVPATRRLFGVTASTIMPIALLSKRSASRWFGSQILIFHFPSVIECVIRGVPNQVPQRPLASQFTL